MQHLSSVEPPFIYHVISTPSLCTGRYWNSPACNLLLQCSDKFSLQIYKPNLCKIYCNEYATCILKSRHSAKQISCSKIAQSVGNVESPCSSLRVHFVDNQLSQAMHFSLNQFPKHWVHSALFRTTKNFK